MKYTAIAVTNSLFLRILPPKSLYLDRITAIAVYSNALRSFAPSNMAVRSPRDT